MAQYEELTIDQGSDVSIRLECINTNGTAKDLLNYTAAGKIKKTYNTSDSDATTFATSIVNPSSSGQIELTLTNAQTTALSAGRHVYDVEISTQDSAGDNVIERIIEGILVVKPNVT
jgi:hypothetical protein|tara:strand:- start:786 stop:1136 length:351 start_codon:yes stop_codon:yes gene_type:complete